MTVFAEARDVFAGTSPWCVIDADNAEVLPGFAAKSVDHVITDPPYSEHVHARSRSGGVLLAGDGGKYRHRKKLDRGSDLGFSHLTSELRESSAKEMAGIAQRWCLAFCDVEMSPSWATAFSAAGIDYVRTGAWVKLGATPQFTGDRPASGFETVVIAHAKGRKRWNGGGQQGVWTHLIERGEREHTTPKPLPLMLELVSLFTDPGDLVLDPFCGSGTTGVACLRLGRRFIGIEKDPKYAQVARDRLVAESRGLTLSAARAGQTSIFDLAGVK